MLRDFPTVFVGATGFAVDPSLRVPWRDDPQSASETFFEAYPLVPIRPQHVQARVP